MAHLCDYLAFPKRIRGGGGVERKLHGGLTQNLGSGEWIRYGTLRVRKRTRRTSSRATRVTVKSWTPWQSAAERGGERHQPRGCAVRATRWRLAGPEPSVPSSPPGIGTLGRRGSPGRAPARRHAARRPPPPAHYRARCPRGTLGSPRTAPGGGRERRAGARRGDRRGSATYLGPRGAPAEPRPGRAGGRGRGARAAGALPWSPAFSAAALGAGRRALHHPTRAPSGGRAARPEGFPAAGSQPRSPRAAPAPPRSESRLSFF